MSRTGVTGEQRALSDDARPLVARLRALTRRARGAGLRHLDAGAGRGRGRAVADGVVVGSALVRFLEERSRRATCGEGAMAEERDVSAAAPRRAHAIEQWRKRIDQIDTQLRWAC